MDTLKIVIIAVTVGLVIVVTQSFTMKDDVRVSGVPGVNLYPQTFEVNTIDLNGSVTLTQGQSGSVIYSTTTAPSTTTLPAARPGLEYTFIVDGAIATGDWVIDSAEGDNIEGTLSVNNADVACAGEDQINFVTDGETTGDWVKLIGYSGGWLIAGSEAETAAKITCTDPT